MVHSIGLFGHMLGMRESVDLLDALAIMYWYILTQNYLEMHAECIGCLNYAAQCSPI